MSQPGNSLRIYLVRHGETEWSKSGQHTGRTDIPLTAAGQESAVALGSRLAGVEFGRVLTSPLARARETCRLAGFEENAIIDADLLEWDYGIYEGRTTLDIRKEQPDWSVWMSPITGGESLLDVAMRAARVLKRVADSPDASAGGGPVALFAHGHILRILAAVWTGLPASAGRYLALDTASVSVLGYERQTRVIRQWNIT